MRLILFSILFLSISSHSYALIIELYQEIGANESIIKVHKIGKIVREKSDPYHLDIENSAFIELPKKPQFLTSKQIYTILKNKYGLAVNIVGKGIKIYPLYTIILDQEIAEKIKTKIYQKYPILPENSIEIMYIKTPKFPKVPAGDLKYKILVPGGKMDLTKYVRLQVQQEEKDIINMSIPIKIIFRIPTWVSKKDLKKGTILKEIDFKKQIKSSLQAPKNMSKLQVHVFGKKLSTNIKKGEILNYRHLF